MKNKTNTTLSNKFQNPIEQTLERETIDTPSTQIHGRSLFWLAIQTLQ